MIVWFNILGGVAVISGWVTILLVSLVQVATGQLVPFRVVLVNWLRGVALVLGVAMLIGALR